jgi:heterodisulfide reductase subunit A-like polyferredoxin
VISPKLVEVGRHTNIDLLTNSELIDLKGEPGNFTATVRRNPRYVDLAKCTSCGECTKVCPIETTNTYDEGLSSGQSTSTTPRPCRALRHQQARHAPAKRPARRT